jgi:hypothetical protein
MSEGSKERSPQQLAESRRDYLAQARMLPVDERTQEVAMINKALGIKAPKGTPAAATLDAARAATAEAIEERWWLRSLAQTFAKSGITE